MLNGLTRASGPSGARFASGISSSAQDGVVRPDHPDHRASRRRRSAALAEHCPSSKPRRGGRRVVARLVARPGSGRPGSRAAQHRADRRRRPPLRDPHPRPAAGGPKRSARSGRPGTVVRDGSAGGRRVKRAAAPAAAPAATQTWPLSTAMSWGAGTQGDPASPLDVSRVDAARWCRRAVPDPDRPVARTRSSRRRSRPGYSRRGSEREPGSIRHTSPSANDVAHAAPPPAAIPSRSKIEGTGNP